MTRYECTLTSELLEKAVTELNEPRDNEERLKAIDELRNSYNADKFGPLVKDDDAFILRFLRAKKFDQKKALTVLQNYHSGYYEYHDVYEKVRNPERLEPILNGGILSFLAEANDGSAVFLYRPGLLGNNATLHDAMACGVVSMEKLLENEKYQICGMQTVEDMDNYSMSKVLAVSPFELARLNSVWQDAMPIRFKGLHLVNEGKLFDILMTLCRPFMKKKIIDRIHTYGTKYFKLHDFIDPSILPPYLDGTGPDPETSSKIWTEKLAEDWTQDTPL